MLDQYAVGYAREFVRNALREKVKPLERYVVVANTEEGLVLVDEGGMAYEVTIRVL